LGETVYADVNEAIANKIIRLNFFSNYEASRWL